MDSDKNDKLMEDLRKAGLSGKIGKTGSPIHIRIWIRDEFKCAYCGEELLKDIIRVQSAQLDHLLPKHKYPAYKDKEENWVLACYACNQWKRTFDPLDHLSAFDRAASLHNLSIYRDELIKITWEICLKKKYEERNKDLDLWNSIISSSNNLGKNTGKGS